ncbi:hypothetical protein BU23DRAFT_570066 [Bimuria novae-zelandiae CBS 107.79]|uniref:Mid2 domain-containing protein n=1 Tax=Bimuria novae-zelandiae CBS 107.79 TaxID=1447943 RepID=A0A6A5V219_9PLEO|nr:hypothetical protein BU23DRAFT_570066 [Bimuria novae-zelandiae CBS 107.79]
MLTAQTDAVMNRHLEACGDNKFCCTGDSLCSYSNGIFTLNPGMVQTIIVTTKTTANSAEDTTANAADSTETSKKSDTKLRFKVGIPVGVIVEIIVIIAAVLLYKAYWRRQMDRRPPMPKPTSKPARPSSMQDPYQRGNAATLEPVSIPSLIIGRSMDAPFENAYDEVSRMEFCS